jgi:NAD(P)H-nitrite reductase large subunit
VGVGLNLDEKYHGMPLPFKFKIGVSGCPNNCSESVIKDLGLVGAPKGWRVLAGGFASGLKPRLADLIAVDLTDAEVIALSERLLDWYKDRNQKKRLGRIIDDLGLAAFKTELGLPAA